MMPEISESIPWELDRGLDNSYLVPTWNAEMLGNYTADMWEWSEGRSAHLEYLPSYVALPELGMLEKSLRRKARSTGREWATLVDRQGGRGSLYQGERYSVLPPQSVLHEVREMGNDYLLIAHCHPPDMNDWPTTTLVDVMNTASVLMYSTQVVVEQRQSVLLFKAGDQEMESETKGLFLLFEYVAHQLYHRRHLSEDKSALVASKVLAELLGVAVYVGESVRKMKRVRLSKRERKLVAWAVPEMNYLAKEGW